MHLSLPRRRAGWIICCFKNLDRKRLSLSLGPKRAWRVMDGSTPDPTNPPSRQQGAVGGSRASSKATHAPSANYGSRKTCTAHSDPSSVRHGPGPCIPPRCPTTGTLVVPLVWCLVAGELPSHLAGSCGPSDRRPPEMPDQSRAVLLATRVGAKAVSLHPQGLRSRDCCQPRPCGREVGGEA